MRRLGVEAAFDLAVAEGDVDGPMQKWLANEACREFAAFELFFSTGQSSSARSAGNAWQRLSPHDRSHWLEQVDDKVLADMFRQMGVRQAGLAASLLSSKLFGDVTDEPDL